MSRRDIYYWKCDRPAAFHGTRGHGAAAETEPALRAALQEHFHTRDVTLRPGAGQGNHLTWLADVDGRALFLRVEDGPEGDTHLAAESAVLDAVRACGVPTPRVFGCDASRLRAPFAWQALERVDAPDLNQWFKDGALDTHAAAFEIGAAVARWQSAPVTGFGPLDAGLRGCHAAYPAYFHLRLERHLAFLVERRFLSRARADEFAAAIAEHGALLDLEKGCLVHKDLALWNILGTTRGIRAFIDFDDAISGDAMDDLSLLGCFHDAAFVARAIEGYQSLRALPAESARRFWLHLLRNMIVKAVIRVGAGYFERDAGFFLIQNGGGSALRERTLERLALALRGLREDAPLSLL
ncbi:MAG TPA: aminoglycoside phosphotransferase family protein [Prosthecobacter sp.]|nr:aminoglycoside phosphotransferase family protein [Prosthecobacter sp.]